MDQMNLFTEVSAVYTDALGPVTNEDLYRAVSERAGISASQLDARVPIGQSGQKHSLLKRAFRWHQQTLKHMGVIERVEGERGVWQLVEPTRSGLHVPIVGVKLVAFSTRLGVAIWGDCTQVLKDLREPVHLLVSSPPYPIRKGRRYGAVSDTEYVDFICASIEPVIRNLVPGGSVVLNISNDVFEQGLPSRSMYCEELLLALRKRFGLSLMDRLVWENPSKPPGPVRYASIQRNQLNATWEPVYWLTNSPDCVRANNRNVLQPHTEKHLKLLANGGCGREAVYSDGAYRLHPWSFGKPTEGRIPRNVIHAGHHCKDATAHRRHAKALGLPAHGAMMPSAIPDLLIPFLTGEGDLVVDPFGGSVRAGKCAERLGRRWLVVDKALDYLRISAEDFRGCDGFEMDGAVAQWPRKAA